MEETSAEVIGITSRRSVRVSLSAAVKRINRRLASDYRMLHRSRSGWERFHHGEFYLRDFYENNIIEFDVDVEALAREAGALASYEWIDFD